MDPASHMMKHLLCCEPVLMRTFVLVIMILVGSFPPQNYNFRPLVLIFPICEHRQGSTRALDIVLGELGMFPSIVCGNKRKLGDLQPLKQLFYTNR